MSVDEFMSAIAAVDVPLANRTAGILSEGKFGAVFSALGVPWPDMVGVFSNLSTFDEATSLATLSPDGLRAYITTAPGSLTPRRTLHAVAKPLFDGIAPFEEVLPFLEGLPSVAAVVEALQDPAATALAAAADSKPLAIALAKPKLVPVLAGEGFVWGDALPSMMAAPTAADLATALTAPVTRKNVGM